MRTSPLVVLFALSSACSRPGLAEPVPQGAVIAGVIDDADALIGGSAGESQLGDVLLKNDRVRFVVQAARDDGHYYESVGGNIIDADITRTEGPDHDPVDEWKSMFGLGRIGRGLSVEVINDGRRSGEAIVRVTAEEAPLTLFTGAVENPGLVPDLGLSIITDYILRPDTPLLEVRSSITVGDEAVELAPGDVLQGGLEAVAPWDPGAGLQAPGEDDRRFTAYLHHHNEGAWAIIPEPGKAAPAGPDGRLLASVGDLIATFEEAREVDAGSVIEHTRYYGVGHDLAAITDAILALDGADVRTESGQVTAGGAPVPGARVHVLVDGEPFTVAVTDEEGRWQADVPEGAQVGARASGQLDGITMDIGEAAGAWGPYADDGRNALVQVSAPAALAAEGYGLASEDAPLTLSAPATLTVRVDDGEPFEVQVRGAAGEQDPRLVVPGPDGSLAMAWAADGEVRLNVPAGEVEVLVHRGMRFERHTESLILEPGGSAELDVSLAPAFDATGWVVADPHSHASPSIDGQATMAQRLLGSAARGIQLHVGTDHDHVADYRGLVERIGLADHLRSVVANEVSPPVRGHFNAWPLTPRELPNGGAVRWWTELPESTDELAGRFTEMGGGERVFVQSNHPLDSGLLEFARWKTGEIGRPDKWTERIDLYELNNAGSVDDYREAFLDLTARGMRLVPVAVSDSHGPTTGGLGLNVTFLGTGTDLAGADDAAIRAALAAGRTVASRGLFLELSVDPGATVDAGTTVEVQAHGASWAQPSRVRLTENGVLIDEVEGSTATFTLTPEADAVYLIEAVGDAPMGGPYGSTTPWAAASPIYVDVGGDGWTAPLSPLQVGG